MPSRRYRDSQSITLNAQGTGSVKIGPQRHGTRFFIESVGVQVSSNVLEPVAKTYRGEPQPGNFISGSFAGSNDNDPMLNEMLYSGEYVTVQWTGGDVGATATATFYGQEMSGDDS